VVEAGREAVAIDVGARGHAGPDVGVVLRERYGGRADVTVDVEELHRAVAAEVGQHVAVAGGAGAGGPAHLHELLDPRVLHERVEDGVRQPQLVGERGAARLAGHEGLEHELRQRVGVEPRLLDRRGRRRQRGLGRLPARPLRVARGRLHVVRGSGHLPELLDVV
jgi:hypothetical protein